MSLIQQPAEGVIKALNKIIGPWFIVQNPGMAAPLFNGIGGWQLILATGSFYQTRSGQVGMVIRWIECLSWDVCPLGTSF